MFRETPALFFVLSIPSGHVPVSGEGTSFFGKETINQYFSNRGGLMASVSRRSLAGLFVYRRLS
jgi:hypothetical protein